MREAVLFIIVVSLLASSAGCSREYVEDAGVREFLKKDTDAAGAVMAARNYNKALIMAYASNDVGLVGRYATDRELNKVRHLIDGFVAQRLRMEAELRSLRIEKIERWGPDNVVVTTSERWRYRRVFTDTGKEQKPLTEIDYHLRYNMVREKGPAWRVFDLSPV